MSVSSAEFRNALSRFASGVTVVTTKDAAGKLHGLTVSAFCSVSLDPPLVLVCIENAAGSRYAFSESGVFTVNILSARQSHISEHFASLAEDKFHGIDSAIGLNGLPLMPGCLAILECRITKILDGGDHTIFVGEVENTSVGDGEPIIHFRSEYRTLE